MRGFTVNPDGSEQMWYTMEDMPVKACASSLSPLQGYAVACHWHEDFEMLTVPAGEIDYFVNGRTVHLRQGEAIFVNARRLHYGFSRRRQDCDYRFVVFHPRVLGTFPGVKRALEEIASDASADFWTFGASSEVLLLFNELYAGARAGDGLRVLAKCAELISEVAARPTEDREGAARTEWALLRRMTGYIQERYTERITLEQIAAAGAVCRNRCCVLFRENLGTTPIEYVTRYRLEKACDALRSGHTVTEAALSNGFHGASYFAEVFRRVYDMTPREYQRGAIP